MLNQWSLACIPLTIFANREYVKQSIFLIEREINSPVANFILTVKAHRDIFPAMKTINQKQIAVFLGVSESFLSDIKHGNKRL